MPDCFDVAAVRHFRDGNHLNDLQSLDNADQLYGFAAECAIKSALVTLHGCIQDGHLVKMYREHVDELGGLAALQSLQPLPARLLAVIKGIRQPFSGWSTVHLYG